MHSESVRLPSDPASAAAGRHFATDVVLDAGLCTPDADVLDVVALITSELVANAVRASADAVTLVVHAGPGGIEIVVFDNAPMFTPGDISDDQKEGGRGLALVAALATEWGQRAVDRTGCKQVWAIVTCPPA